MYRIENIIPKNSASIPIGNFTVIVGSNNAGKSQILRDISFCASGSEKKAKILDGVGVNLGRSAREFLSAHVDGIPISESGSYYLDGSGISLDESSSIQYDKNNLHYFLTSEEEAMNHINQSFSRELIAYLTTEARLTFSKHRTNLYRPQQRGTPSLVEALFNCSNDVESWLSERTVQAFGLAVALDTFTSAGALELRVAPSFAGLKREDRFSASSVMQQSARLDEQGDGLRSFVATLGAAKTLSRDVMLVDEPEAFLHPPQAFQIGRALRDGDFGGKQFICATHSADFLRGVLSAKTDVTVIRVSRSKVGQSISVLSRDELQAVAEDPVLSSGRVLDGIFYRQAIITESDGDAVLYNALSANNDLAGETYYVNSYSKQAAAAVSAPYRHMGVPHAAIVDLDLIRVGPEFVKVARAFIADTREVEALAERVRSHIEGAPTADFIADVLEQTSTLADQLRKLSLPDAESELEWLRARLKDIRAGASAWSKLKRSGIHSDSLEPDVRNILCQLIATCASHGLFLVPVGERESWLEPDVPYSKNKSAYTTRALEYVASAQLRADAPIAVFMKSVHEYLAAR